MRRMDTFSVQVGWLTDWWLGGVVACLLSWLIDQLVD